MASPVNPPLIDALSPGLSPLDKARVLSEALPWISRFSGKTFVVKYGGAAMKEGGLRADFARDIVLLRTVGINVVVVHGGGPQIDVVLARLGIQSQRVRGQRVTDAATMEVVEMVLAGKINQDLCALFNLHGGRAVGLSGHDGAQIICEKMLEDGVDLGLVGDPKRVDPSLLKSLLAGGFIPVIAPIGADESGGSLNVNADLIAAAVAGALQAEKLVLLTDVEGVLDPKGKLIQQLDAAEVEAAIARGEIGGGMIPKVRCCLTAMEKGVGAAHIVDGRQPHTLLIEAFTDRGIGTKIGRRVVPKSA